MITRVEVFLRSIQRFCSRSEWAIRLLRLPKLKQETGEPGLVMVQIDGLSLTQFSRALQKGHVPFLSSLLRQERYALHAFYSGLPSNTPAVQAELMYGIKGCVPAFNYIDRKSAQIVKMMDHDFVEQFEERLKPQGEGLLTGGSSYSNIFTGGATEAHFCWAKLGWGGVLNAVNPLVFPFLVILYIDIFIRTAFLLVVEFFIALPECIRGSLLLKGHFFFEELRFVWLRVLICVMLREIIVAGVCIDIMRGLPIIHMNFLGYDEQAHCRGPASRYAHWSLKGIDHAIRRIQAVTKQSPYRDYDVWVYGDHGQERTTPYPVKYGLTIQEAVENLFAVNLDPTKSPPTKPSVRIISQEHRRPRYTHAGLLHGRPTVSLKDIRSQTSHKQDHVSPTDEKQIRTTPQGEVIAIDFKERESIVTAMGPLGQVYVKKKLTKEDLESYARKLVSEVKIPLVLTREGEDHEKTQKVRAWTPRGSFLLPEQTAEVFGKDHPFVEEFKEDIIRMCYHLDAGEFVLAGWCKGEPPISLSLEYGAHAAMGPEETKSFAMLPIDAPHPVGPQQKTYLRPLDMREMALRFLNKQTFDAFQAANSGTTLRPLRLMSYNVHGCLGMDGNISTERVARVIARQNPDIIALQELDIGRMRSKGIDQVAKIAKNLGMKYHFHPALLDKDEQYGNAILSRYPMALIKMGPLPQFAKNKTIYEPRGAMWITLEFQGSKIQIINTHLSIWPKERLLQINALLGPEWLGNPDCIGPAVLCGDFNAFPGSMVYKKVCYKFKDSQVCLVGHRPHRTWYGRYPLGQVDHIFVSPEFDVHWISVPRTTLDKLASDHLPLSVDLSFKENPFHINLRAKEDK